MSLWLHDELRRRAFFTAGRRMGTARAMARLVKELKQIDLLAETSARLTDPPILVIDGERGAALPLHPAGPAVAWDEARSVHASP